MPTVADILIDGLRRAGVQRIFGVPGGGSNLELLEAARGQGLPFVLCHQESAACIMAAVTGELTGAPGATPAPLPQPSTDDLDSAAAMIRQAKRPVVVAGLQCRGTEAKWLRAFAEALPAPVLTTYKAKGALPDPHPLAMGVFTGGALEEPAVSRADLIIAFGLDTVELIPRRWSYTAPVLSLVRGPSQGGAGYFTPALEVVGDLGVMLEEL